MRQFRLFTLVVLWIAIGTQFYLAFQYRRMRHTYEGMIQQRQRGERTNAFGCSVIHEPKGGCPSGFTKEPNPRFTEKDGKREYACVSDDPKKEPCTDEIRGGESMELWLPIPVPKMEAPKGPRI